MRYPGLGRADSLQNGAPLRSILFPLLGTGQGSAKVEELVDKLLMAAISHLECKPDTQIQTVYFLAWTDRELQACQKIPRRHRPGREKSKLSYHRSMPDAEPLRVNSGPNGPNSLSYSFLRIVQPVLQRYLHLQIRLSINLPKQAETRSISCLRLSPAAFCHTTCPVIVSRRNI